MATVYAVIPAAGVGERMGTQIPKQYCQVFGKPLIFHTVEAFLKIPLIQKVIIVCASGSINHMKNALNGLYKGYLYKLSIVEGGLTRHRSIAAGIKYLEKIEPPPEIVIIHDGVRPLVPPVLVSELVQNAAKYGSAGPIRPLVSTVLAVNKEGFLEESLDRSKYWASEMPQAFKYEYIRLAYENCSEHDLEFGTECLHLVHKYCNVQPKLVKGGSDLWKVTHKKDLYAAEGILREKQRILITTEDISGSHKLVESLNSALSLQFNNIKTSVGKPDVSDFWAVINVQRKGSLYHFVSQLNLSEFQTHGFNGIKCIYVFLGDEQLKDKHYRHATEDEIMQISQESQEMHLFLYFVSSSEEEPSSSSMTAIVELVQCFLVNDAKALCGRLYCI